MKFDAEQQQNVVLFVLDAFRLQGMKGSHIDGNKSKEKLTLSVLVGCFSNMSLQNSFTALNTILPKHILPCFYDGGG